MKTILVKTEINQNYSQKIFVRYRLYAIKENYLDHLASEKNLPDIIRELISLDNPEVCLELNELNESDKNLVHSNQIKIKELDNKEKNRFFNYTKKPTKGA